VESSTPEALGALLRSEIDKWGPVIKAAGISASN
jgi:tripartite-type tricarboxylate transporter receptor subunit TctC